MSFVNDIAALIGDGAVGYTIIDFNGHTVFADGYKRVLSIANDEIALDVQGGCVRICGEGLYIKKCSPDSIVVCGKIALIKRE